MAQASLPVSSGKDTGKDAHATPSATVLGQQRIDRPPFRPARAVLVILCLVWAWPACSKRTNGPPDPSFLSRDFVTIPGGVFDEGDIGSFALGRFEVTVRKYCRYLNSRDAGAPVDHPQIEYRVGRYVPRRTQGRKAVAHVSFDDAMAYCRWLSREFGLACRLSTGREWEHAAQAGFRGAPYPWGWGSPRGRAAFDLDGPRRVGSYPANTLGLHDMAGGVAEWCLPEEGDGDGSERVVLGGSWAERDPDLLRVSRHVRLPADYRDADVGFRIRADLPPARNAQAETHH